MFGFDKPEDGSHERFGQRLNQFRKKGINLAVHHAWWIIHNAVAHPLIGFLPIKSTFKFHDFTSNKITPEHPLDNIAAQNKFDAEMGKKLREAIANGTAKPSELMFLWPNLRHVDASKFRPSGSTAKRG